MACRRCVEALEKAGQVLHEMVALDTDSLPAGTDWQEIGIQLIKLAGRLRIQGPRNDLL